MESVFTILLLLFVLVAIVAFKKWHEASQERSLRTLVGWSTSSDNHIRCNLALSAYIYKAQIRLLENYRISGDEERKAVNEILEEYRKNLVQAYFAGKLSIPKSKYVVQGQDYFMFALYAFLSDHQCDYEFLGHDMHKERISYKSYGSAFNSGFDATYSLTDFAVVFHKMHYIAYMYCRGSEILKNYVPAWNEEKLKEILDTKQIQLSRF